MDLDNKYEKLASLLMEFTINYGSDEEVIKNYVQGRHPESIRQSIAEGEEVLAMEPFPNDWVGDMINGAYYDPEAGRAWLKKVLKMVEEEAIQIGKLPADCATKFR